MGPRLNDGEMDYNHDTNMELIVAAGDLRQAQNQGSNLPDCPLRGVTAAADDGRLEAPVDGSGVTLGGMISALRAHCNSPKDCGRLCDEIRALATDKGRKGIHAEIAELGGVTAVVAAVRKHAAGNAKSAISGLQLLEALSRPCPRDICRSGGIDAVVAVVDSPQQQADVVAAALRVLHGLTFDSVAKDLLIKRGVHGLAQDLKETHADEDVRSVALRLYRRLPDGCLGHAHVWRKMDKNKVAPSLPQLAEDRNRRHLVQIAAVS